MFWPWFLSSSSFRSIYLIDKHYSIELVLDIFGDVHIVHPLVVDEGGLIGDCSIFVEAPPNCFVDFFVGHLDSILDGCVDVVCVGGLPLDEEK